MNIVNSIIFILILILIQSFAADKGRIIFTTAYSGKWDLWAVRPDGKNLSQVTDTVDDEHFPAVSPDGKEILFIDAQRNHLLSGLTWR